MTKKLEEELNLPDLDQLLPENDIRSEERR